MFNKRIGRMKFLGIDLAGSEKRDTGIAVIDENLNVLHVSIVHKDSEIIETTKRFRPEIIAIDAPLSLPRGRKNIDENNGIHFRKCDLELRKMKIKFFPITLGPMRMLTKRGIKLKGKLEALGYKVIETYPGAVQDILKIPRKSKGIEKLRNGLLKIGIKNIPERSTHDELDAITCALIAKNYYMGDYVEIGDIYEGTIVLPKI